MRSKQQHFDCPLAVAAEPYPYDHNRTQSVSLPARAMSCVWLHAPGSHTPTQHGRPSASDIGGPMASAWGALLIADSTMSVAVRGCDWMATPWSHGGRPPPRRGESRHFVTTQRPHEFFARNKPDAVLPPTPRRGEHVHFNVTQTCRMPPQRRGQDDGK